MKNAVLYCFFLGCALYAQDGYRELYEKGFAQLKSRNYEAAIDFFQQAYKIKAHSQIAYYIAYTCYFKGDMGTASLYAQKALNGVPDLASLGGQYVANCNYFIQQRNADSTLRILTQNTISENFSMSIDRQSRDVDYQLSMIEEDKRKQRAKDSAISVNQYILRMPLPFNYDSLENLHQMLERSGAQRSRQKQTKWAFLFPLDTLREDIAR
jgi:tetratricopeptide (TPR) repeat protein